MVEERNGSRSLLIFIAGGLIGAGLSMLYTPMTGEKTRQYLRIQTKKARIHQINEDILEIERRIRKTVST